MILYHLCGKGDISAGLYKHTPMSANAVMFDLVDEQGGRAAPTRPSAPDASLLGIDLTGAPDCLCVYRSACSKSITLQKNAKRAGLYPYTPQHAKDNGDPPKTVRSGGLDVVDVERWRLRAAQEEDEEFAPYITLLERGERALRGSYDRSSAESTLMSADGFEINFGGLQVT